MKQQGKHYAQKEVATVLAHLTKYLKFELKPNFEYKKVMSIVTSFESCPLIVSLRNN